MPLFSRLPIERLDVLAVRNVSNPKFQVNNFRFSSRNYRVISIIYRSFYIRIGLEIFELFSIIVFKRSSWLIVRIRSMTRWRHTILLRRISILWTPGNGVSLMMWFSCDNPTQISPPVFRKFDILWLYVHPKRLQLLQWFPQRYVPCRRRTCWFAPASLAVPFGRGNSKTQCA